ncbi:MAG: diaminopimelate epimerase [Gammaproteobacteria bacterium]|nr:diaminopimelate epimerase [Gammaproteobacteria bacterium]
MLEFTKMHGLGNDFVVIDATRKPVQLSDGQLKAIADRHFGIGCDQILVVEQSSNPAIDFRYRIFNADGSEVGQCGNGARCFARFVQDKQLTDKNIIRVETQSSLMTLTINPDDTVSVNLGVPVFEPNQVPLLAESRKTSYTLSIDGQTISYGAVSLGNPHAVILVDKLDLAPVQSLGAVMENHQIFPERANIGFMQIIDLQHIQLRVFERGAGETLACGSGACAAVVVGIEQGHLDSPVTVDLPGGSLTIEWQGEGQPVIMTGTATTVFEGSMTL